MTTKRERFISRNSPFETLYKVLCLKVNFIKPSKLDCMPNILEKEDFEVLLVLTG